VLGVCVHVEGHARITRRGETIALQRGDIFITDSRHEFALDLERPWRHLLVALPTCWLDSRVARPEALAGLVLRDHPLARLWANHLAAGFALAGELSSDAGILFARQSVDLLAQLLHEWPRGECTTSQPVRDAIFLNACRIISLKYGDPRLSPASIAQSIGVSSRTLARVFAARNQSVMRRVFDERVDQAAKLLASRACAHRSVTDIAFACGFSDVSHFGRVFSDKVHMTPSQWRRRRQSSQDP